MSGFFNGLPNHVIRPIENWTKKCPKSKIFGFWVLSIQMVPVLRGSENRLFVAHYENGPPHSDAQPVL